MDATNSAGPILQYAEVELFVDSNEKGISPYFSTFWSNATPGTDLETGYDDDYDKDGRNNLYEYALNGDPEDRKNDGSEPTFVKGLTSFDYVHLQRNDDPRLSYEVQTCADLVAGSWTNTGSTITGTNVTGDAYDDVTNSIPADSPQRYIRLRIETQ